MARGNIAKVNIINKLKENFGADFIGEVDKKVYLWADDGGEKVQIALALTCPKVMIESPEPAVDVKSVSTNGWNFDDMPTPTTIQKAVITDQEKKNIQDMMARLGL